jgi:tetratricopeptide (TPR) repeat protein
MPSRSHRRSSSSRVADADLVAAPLGDGDTAADRRRVAAIAVGLMLAVAAVFGGTVRFGFTGFDDPLYVTENSMVLRGLTPEGLAWAFTTDHASTWVPLTWLSLMLDAGLHGSWSGGYHLTNVLLHAANAAGLFLLLRGATGRTWPAAAAAAIFAVHPLRVEAVAWVTARKDVLSGLCFLLTLQAYGWYVRRPSPARYAVVAASLAVGLTAKSMLVTMPLLLLLLDFWPLGRMRERRDLIRLTLEKLPLALLSLAASAITLAVQGDALATDRRLSLGWRLGQSILAYVGYLGMFLWPANLAASYPRPEGAPPRLTVAVAAALLLAITLVACRERRRFPYLLVGWLWYLVAFLPAIGLVQIGAVAMADRFTYLPLLGPVVALVWLAADLVGADGVAGRWRSGRGVTTAPVEIRRAAAGIAAGGLVAGLAVASYLQTAAWRDSETLWRRTLERTGDNWFAHLSMAGTLIEQRRFEEAEAQVRRALKIDRSSRLGRGQLAAIAAATGRPDEALAICEAIIGADPRDLRARNLAGLLLARKNRHAEALGHFQAALVESPDSVDALVGAAEALLRSDRPDEAMSMLARARSVWPDHPLVARQFGRVLLATGRTREAAASLRRAVDHDPADGAAWNALGVALGQSGRLEDSIAALERAVAVEPGSSGFHRDLGFALRQEGRFAAAANRFRQAIALQRDNGVATNDLAWLLATCPDPAVRAGAEAVTLAAEASRLAGGDDPTVLDTLAAAHAETGDFAAAIDVARKALGLAEDRKDAPLAAEVRAHLDRFGAGRPVRDPPESPR